MSYIIYENCSILEQKQKSASLSSLPLTIEKMTWKWYVGKNISETSI